MDKIIDTIREALREAIDAKAGMQYLKMKMRDVVVQIKDHEKRITNLEATRELHFEKVKSAFLEAQSRLQIPHARPND